MKQNTRDLITNEFKICENILEIIEEAEVDVKEAFERIDRIKEFNQLKVIKAMQDSNVSDSHFAGSTGYGYGDRGREVLDCVYAQVFKAEDALVRHQISTGTQAIALSMFGNLRPGDELLSATGKPYDTIEETIGIRGEGNGSLKDFGIFYRQVDLLDDGHIDFKGIKEAINEKTKMIYIQRSRGYSWRPSLTINDIKALADYIKCLKKEAIVFVDNCYGEFVEDREPLEVGADIVAGSLIKNPGGGIAPAGGYIAGRKRFVERAAYRLTAPGLGKNVGSTLGQNRLLFQGLFLSPHVVAESLKGAVLCSAVMGKLGFKTSPAPSEKRTDIIQAIKFKNEGALVSFCQGIQKGSPVDSYVLPEPWDMPGYDCSVIMASGAFIQGASIELSADAPVKPPYIAYMQGGLVYEHVKLGIMSALKMMKDKGIVEI